MWRWTYGTIQIAKLRTRNVFKSDKIPLSLKIELFLNNLVWFAGPGVIIAAFCYLVIFWGNFSLLRPEYALQIESIAVIIPGYLIMSTAFIFATFIGSLLGILSAKAYHWIIYLIGYGVASISLFFFLITPVIYAMLGIKGPEQDSSPWNRNINIFHYMIALIPFGLFSLVTAITAFTAANIQWIFFLVITIAALSPFPFAVQDKFIDKERLEDDYFTKLKSNLVSNKYKSQKENSDR
jgi:hypothetical protein